MNYSANWNYPTTIWFGADTIKKLHTACEQLGIKHPLLVTDKGLAGMDMFNAVLGDLQKHGLNPVVFHDIKANPTVGNVDAGSDICRQHGCDGVIAIGGGSALDAAKTIALVADQACSVLDLEDIGDNFKQADSDKILPCIAVPTTAGTGSEVGRASLIVDTETHSKKIIFHPEMTPDIVIADPALTCTLPPKLTAATGMDALAHNLEAFCAPGFHPMADGIALEGMRFVKEWLPVAYKNGSNLEARTHMLAASTMGATAFQKGLGAIHSLSHPVGAIYDAHHGLLNAIFMPYVLKLNRDTIDDKMERLANYLSLEGDTGFDAVYNWVLDLMQQLDLPTDLKSIGVDDKQADEVARQAMQDGSTASNPLALTHDLLKTTFLSALIGNL
jgi:alcohol dehydrogenase class IV